MSVTIIGAGLAGTVAAARLAALGQTVRVIHDRPGVTPMHGGGWLLGLETLARAGVPTGRMDEALALVTQGLADLGLQDGPFDLRDADGVLREVDVAPASHAAAARLPAGSAAVDLLGLGHPFAEMCSGFKVLAVEWPTWPGAFGRSYAAAAAQVEADASHLSALTAALQQALATAPAPGLLLPPVLGVAGVEARRLALEAALGVPVAEALGTIPSTPGLRLWQALAAWRARLAPAVVEVQGRVTAVDLAARTLTIGDAKQPFDALILATGGLHPGRADERWGGDGAPPGPAHPARDRLRLAALRPSRPALRRRPLPRRRARRRGVPAQPLRRRPRRSAALRGG